MNTILFKPKYTQNAYQENESEPTRKRWYWELKCAVMEEMSRFMLEALILVKQHSNGPFLMRQVTAGHDTESEAVFVFCGHILF